MDTPHAALIKRTYDEPDERRTPPNSTVDVVHLGNVTTARLTFQPGWRWSESVKPVVGTDLCEQHHVGVVIAGRLGVSHGSESMEVGPGDTYVIEPGHDAWVIGDDTFVGCEFDNRAAETYATTE
jgi:mannose-6-phosphate isomerase-like protein (cupin superfamily)